MAWDLQTIRLKSIYKFGNLANRTMKPFKLKPFKRNHKRDFQALAKWLQIYKPLSSKAFTNLETYRTEPLNHSSRNHLKKPLRGFPSSNQIGSRFANHLETLPNRTTKPFKPKPFEEIITGISKL